MPSLIKESSYWFLRNLRYIFHSSADDERNMRSWLMVKTHIIEKGITMPGRRLGFGYERVRSLIAKSKRFISLYSNQSVEIQTAINDLEQYLEIHRESNFELPDDIRKGIEELLEYKSMDTVKCYPETSSHLFENTKDFAEFSVQRRSVRWYSDRKIDHETLAKVIELAKSAPSACNRQSVKVYIIESEEKKKKVLSLQTGNRGFGESADKLLLITTDQRCWETRELPLGYIDSGIFTMNLLYALHYHKICACTLNAILSIRNRKKLMKVIGYSESEIPVVFISIGYAPDTFMVPGSQRLNTEDLYSFI